MHKDSLVTYGDVNQSLTEFKREGAIDREIKVGQRVRFRLIRKGRLTEFYLNGYLMQCYSLPVGATGKIGVIGSGNNFNKLKAWYCA